MIVARPLGATAAVVSVALSLGACDRPDTTGSTTAPAPAEVPSCGGDGVAVQVLGSGGPIPDDGRASASYLVWRDGRPLLLVDAGGGTFVRFGEAGGLMAELEVIALTHVHTDHSADLPALLKGLFFTDRTANLPVFGPSGDERFPGTGDFLGALLGSQAGAYRYLSWLLEGGGEMILVPTELDPRDREGGVVHRGEAWRLRFVAVEHGPVPAVAYRVDIDRPSGTVSVAFSGDQNGQNPQFGAMANAVDLLVMHHAVPEDTDRVAAALHARPSEIGDLARDARPAQLVLSHHMARSLAQIDETRQLIERRYAGPVTFADDLDCFALAP